MSIAASVVVKPSRLLSAMAGTMSLVCCAIGIAIGLGVAGELSPGYRMAIAGFTVFLSFFGFYHGACYGKTIHMDISATGQLRIAEMSADGTCADTNRPHVNRKGEVVRIMNNSTIWPHLLLLRLQSVSGKITIVPILPDSVSRDGFRALSVACRWMVTRNHSPGHDIL
jgi:toxin CptA